MPLIFRNLFDIISSMQCQKYLTTTVSWHCDFVLEYKVSTNMKFDKHENFTPHCDTTIKCPKLH